MIRTFALFAIGLLLGVVLGFQYARSLPEGDSALGDAGATRSDPLDGAGEQASDAGFVPGARPAARIEELLDQLEVRSRAVAGPLQRQELDDLLLELGRRDALAAADAALMLDLEPAVQASALARLALSDADAALERLGALDDPLVVRNGAVALFRALGEDAAALDRVLAALPSHVAGHIVRSDVYGELTSIAPDRALAMALAEPDLATRGDVLQRIAFSWAARAPRAALERLDLIGDPVLAERFEDVVLRSWAQSDAAGAISRIEERLAAGGGATAGDASVLSIAARSRPELVHASVREHEDPALRSFALLALEEWAARDPASAFAAWEAGPADAYRGEALVPMVRAAAATDPELALAWARGRVGQRHRSEALVAALSGIRDVDRAVAAITGEGDAEVRRRALLELSRFVAFRADARRLADRLLMAAEPEYLAALDPVLAGWSQRDPGGVLDWHALHPDAPQGAWLSEALGGLAAGAPGEALAALDALPVDEQPEQFVGMLVALASRDLGAALTALDRWDARSGHPEAVARVAGIASRVVPEEAAALLARHDVLDEWPEAAADVAVGWAWSDPGAAISWAAALPDEQGRSGAVEAALLAYAYEDDAGVRVWVARQAREEERDRLYAELAHLSVDRGEPDLTLVDAIEDAATRERVRAELLARMGP